MIFVSLYNPTDCHPANYDQDKLLEIIHSKINWCNIFEILLYFLCLQNAYTYTALIFVKQ